MRRVVACLVSALLAAAAPAAAGAPPTFQTLGEAVRAALETQEAVGIAAAEARKSAVRTRRYRLAVTPDVRLRGFYLRTDEEGDPDPQQGGGGPPGRQVGWSLELTQPLYTGGRATAAYRGQKALERSASLAGELVRRQTAVAAAEAWFGTLAAVDAVRIAEEAAASARRHLERATRRVELGEAVRNDQLQAEVVLRRIEGDLASARGGLANAREAVRRVAGGYPADRPAVPERLPPIAASADALVAEALAGRIEPRQAGLGVTAAEQDVREKRGRFHPSLALTGAYARQGEDLGELSWQWSAGIAIELPLYQSGQRLNEMRESQAGLEQARLAAAAAARDVELEVRSLANDLAAAAARVESLHTAEEAAAEGLRLSERRYEVGLADGLEVVDATLSLTAARTALAAERYRVETLKLSLAAALGRDPVALLAGAP